MPDEPALSTKRSLQQLPYQSDLVQFLKRIDRDVWQWFADRRLSEKYAEDTRFELLKTTYRVEREAQPDLYSSAQEVADFLGVQAPLTIYQAQNPSGLNASIAYVPGQVHLVLHGPILDQLTPLEVRGLLAHELGHYLLWDQWNGELLIASEVLTALVNDPHAHPAHFATWRLFRLYAEVFCDRAALSVTDDLASVVSMLVKVETGVREVDPAAYFRQADEIFAKGSVSTTGLTHPETYIRARAAQLWHRSDPDCDDQVAHMIGGEPGIDELDLLEQQRIAAATRRLLDALLCHKWFQTDLVLAQARLYFDNYEPPSEILVDSQLEQAIRGKPDSLRDYFCYVMLDFISADRDLEEPPVAVALLVAEQLGVKSRLIDLIRQDIKLRKNQVDRIDGQKEKIIAEADRATAVVS